ncbi:MAG: hypothetical protein QF903_07810 [Planctomycetota bacterium]|jgi:hypothetical protein|nr:hypothetical protein [Planctomycetota bacterium]MDP6762765.1 hypothetical protein [Planctomycetota bacterium]MDP6989370.1 hypothetical protein [Planctomycetota bacterium]
MRLHSFRRPLAVLSACALATVALGALFDMSLRDFVLSGTHAGQVGPSVIFDSNSCVSCHGDYDSENAPHDTWEGSLMAQAGRDPLFWAQMTNANQDVANVGYYCMRCHVPNTFVSGHAYDPSGTSIDEFDRDGVSCHFCHAMVDPIFDPGSSPPEDVDTLSTLDAVPGHYANSMFVLDHEGKIRGPYADSNGPHANIHSPFHRDGDMCGTCHDVGNLAVTRQPDGTYTYNGLDAPTPSEDPWQQFPLERTYSEWKLSAFANGGVDMGGLFGGEGGGVVSSCQDCHMPKVEAQGASWGPVRTDLAKHEFAGASAWVLEIIGLLYADDPAVDPAAIAVGRQKAIEMVERAATLELSAGADQLMVRVINQTGHKIPTGHIEGRRIFLNVKVFDDQGELLVEYGHYDYDTAHLDADTTKVYEMHVGLSAQAAAATGLPEGVTTHMALADTIEKDNRIPPRGFTNRRFEDAGAPVVGAAYADGQHWDDTRFDLPAGAARAVATLYYQTVTRHYIEALRDGNVTNHWGETLYRLWLQTNKCAPIEITSEELLLP